MKKQESSDRHQVTRRDFLKGAALGTVGAALAVKQSVGAFSSDRKIAVPFSAAAGDSTVVLIRDEAAVDASGKVNPDVVAGMIDKALAEFSGEKDAAKAWSKYIAAGDTVGVKFTKCDWMRIHTDQSVIDAVLKRIADCKVSKTNIHAQDGGLPVDKCTVLINLPSVKCHTLTGIAVSMKNYINLSPKPSQYHGKGSENLGEIWTWPQVKGKTRLIVVDMMRPYFGPGPQVNPLHRWNYNGILVATDPVAVDTVCLRVCQAKRNLFKGEDWPVSPPPYFLKTADEKFGLGTSDFAKIKLVRLGWNKDILI